MARRTLIWHLGPAQPARPLVAANLEVHAEALASGRLARLSGTASAAN
jgi:hypothetical protein